MDASHWGGNFNCYLIKIKKVTIMNKEIEEMLTQKRANREQKLLARGIVFDDDGKTLVELIQEHNEMAKTLSEKNKNDNRFE